MGACTGPSHPHRVCVYVELTTFRALIRDRSPSDLAAQFLEAGTVAAFDTSLGYQAFLGRIREVLGAVETAAIVGSGNWTFSLNPQKAFRPFGPHSDIDVAIVSPERYNFLWEEMRLLHRNEFYRLSYPERRALRRSGENVYSGFISPTWIPHRDPRRALEYKRILNGLSDASVAYRPVKMMFFKNLIEAVDYYGRGFIAAKKDMI